MNNPYADNLTENKSSNRAFGKNKLWRQLIVVVLVVAIATGGFFGIQQWQRGRNQINLLKSANESYVGDARYTSFRANYIFAVAQSHTIDESSIPGAQLLMPSGASLKADNFDQLFEADVVAVQSLSEVNPNDNKSLKKYVEETLVPDLKTNISQDVKVSYAYRGKYKAATIVVTKDGRQVRQEYAYSGSHPYMVIAQIKSDAFNEVVDTLVGIDDSTAKDDIDQAKQVLQSSMTLVQADKLQELYDGASNDFRQKTSFSDLKSAVNSATSFIHRDIVIPGGSIQADQFVGLLTFPQIDKDEKKAIGSISLVKVDGQWKLQGLSLPSAPAPTPAPKKK